MTCIEWLRAYHPEAIMSGGNVNGCPHHYGLMDRTCMHPHLSCTDCWNQEFKAVLTPRTGKIIKLLSDTNREVQSSISITPPVPEIRDVIFNGPATIVFWDDGTKTVVKCQEGDDFDPYIGIVMAFMKKMHGNTGKYCNELRKWAFKYYMDKMGSQELDDILNWLVSCLGG